MNNFLNDIPSIPTIPSRTPLNVGITTRVMAKKQAIQREQQKTLQKDKDKITNFM